MIRRRGALGAVLLATLVVAAPVTLARFTASDTSTATLATGTIAPPASLAGTDGALATLAWTPTVTSAASGYYVFRSATSGGGYSNVGTVTPASASTTTDSPGAGTWYYFLRAYLQNWTSSASNEASVVIASGSTGYKGCASNGPETTGSGDNNGYETGPGNACAQDGAYATDANSGTNNTNSCTDAGKDRHRFWGYAYGLPGTVTSIDGITLQVVAGLSNNGGTSVLCAELSWDGGTTWTAARSVNLTSVGLTAYTMGGPADTWGHAPWTASQLGTSMFRVRITDVSTQTTKDFHLDFVGAQVTYTP